ncbi:hypothetical protein Tdes44962_MAKER01292 [Teratosphaeria destructans]|uniref:Uncharacterized protein n=1 Tax=Teratosphaeria destructans TaxID=418781 RepID=A0A9W7W6V7_9PEZI|nr:hypothetical protein Tdes44962_MAKER01292 [Teratosphaeria destructans]
MAPTNRAAQSSAMDEVAVGPVATVPNETAQLDTPVQAGTQKLRLVHNKCTCADRPVGENAGESANQENGLFTPPTSSVNNERQLTITSRRRVEKWIEGQIPHSEQRRAEQRINKALKDSRERHRANERINKSLREYRVRRLAGQRIAAAIKARRNAHLRQLAADALDRVESQERN